VGDTLWGTPAIRALKESFPDSLVGVLTNRLGADLLSGNPYIDRLYQFHRGGRGLAGLLRELRRERYDTVFVFHASDRIIYPLIVLTGASEIIGYREDCKGLDSLLTKVVAFQAEVHGVTRRFHLMEGFGVNSYNNSLAMYLSKEEELHAVDILRNAGIAEDQLLLVVHPGAQKPYKVWPASSYVQAAGELARRHGLRVIVTGNDQERNLAEEVAKGIPDAVSMAGDLTLRETAAILARSSLMLTNDTGPMHISFALGKPTVAIFAPTNPELCGPNGAPNASVVRGTLVCDPCIGKKCLTPRCLEQITVAEVVGAAEELLKNTMKYSSS